MQKDDLVYAGHMLDMARKALDMVRGKNRQDYNSDETLRFALVHIVQVIGEATRRVSKQCCDAHPQIPWKAIVGMRHKVVHDYYECRRRRGMGYCRQGVATSRERVGKNCPAIKVKRV